MSTFAVTERTCGVCGETLRAKRRPERFGRRGWYTAYVHRNGSEDCPEPARFGGPSAPCPYCGRIDCAVTGNPDEWFCHACEVTFRPVKVNPLDDLEERDDQHGHHPSTLVAVNGTRARCADTALTGAMAKAVFADVIGDDLHDTIERRPA